MDRSRKEIVWFRYLYWLVPIVLLILQAVYTFNSTNQIRTEELDESVRNVYWLQNHKVFSESTKNFGWHAPILIIYNLFGFDLFAGKYFKLFLHLISLICTAIILKKYLGFKNAVIPFVTIFLSPTWLFFESLAIPQGADLDYLLICFYLAYRFNLTRSTNYLIDVLYWIIIMFAWLTYPTFIFFIPLLFIIYLFILSKKIKKSQLRLKHLLISLISFITPIAVIFVYLKDKSNFLNGLFVASGIVDLSINNFFIRLNFLFEDLFIKGIGYYSELTKVEFSNYYPALSVSLVVCLSIFVLRKNEKIKIFVWLTILTFLVNIILINLTSYRNWVPWTSQGLRRFTPAIASFYILFVLSWHYSVLLKKRYRRIFCCLILFFIPLHHILVYSENLTFVKTLTENREKHWFDGTNPTQSLNLYLDGIKQHEVLLQCPLDQDSPTFCRFDLIFSSIKGACFWNHLHCNKLLILSPTTNKIEDISIE